jgi:hypothetical protein
VKWYASWRGFFSWKAPAHVAVFLHDPRCRRIARRRLLLWVLLPCLVAMVGLLALNCVVDVRRFEVWWEMLDAPGLRFNVRQVTREDRFLSFFSGSGIFSSEEQERLVAREVALRWPALDKVVTFFILLPALGVISLLFDLVALQVVRRIGARDVDRRAVMALVAHFGSIYAVAVLGLFALALVANAVHVWDSAAARDPWDWLFPAFLTAMCINLAGGAMLLLGGLCALRPRRVQFPVLLQFAGLAGAIVVPALVAVATILILAQFMR